MKRSLVLDFLVKDRDLVFQSRDCVFQSREASFVRLYLLFHATQCGEGISDIDVLAPIPYYLLPSHTWRMSNLPALWLNIAEKALPVLDISLCSIERK